MKKSLLAGTFIISLSAFSSDDIEKVKNKIEAQLDSTTNRARNLSSQDARNISIPWNVLDQRNSNFWNSTVNAYDFLMKNGQKERYNFLYEAAKAYANSYPENLESLSNWISLEDKRVYSLGLSFQFYKQWKVLAQDIKNNISELKEDRPQVEIKSDARGILLENKNFLESLQTDVINFEKNFKVEIKKNSHPVIDQKEPSQSTSHMMTFFWAVLSFVTGLLIAKRMNRREISLENMNSATHKNATTTQTLDNFKETNLEDAFQTTLKDYSHLTDMAKLKFLPYTSSSFRNSISVSDEKISEGLHYFLKGAIALSNTHSQEVSHVEWKCLEKMGRVFLELNLHGIETDQKNLYTNALMDGNGSAPAHFGRTEQLLAESLPVVSLRTSPKKTTVTLSLEGNFPVTPH